MAKGVDPLLVLERLFSLVAFPRSLVIAAAGQSLSGGMGASGHWPAAVAGEARHAGVRSGQRPQRQQ